MNRILKWVDMKNKINVTKLGGATMGVCPKRTLQNPNFLTTHPRHMKFSGWANMKKRFPKRGSPKFKLFHLLKMDT